MPASRPNTPGEPVKLTAYERAELLYAGRNHGRNFVTDLPDEPCNAAIHRLTDLGMFVDGGPSASGRWRDLTPAGRALLARLQQQEALS